MPTALLVDDDPASRRALAKWVEKERFEVETASTLEQARDRMSRDRFDVLLVDLQLPDGNGIELLQDDGADITGTEVVVVTGHGTIETAVEAMRGGAVDYITKPVDVQRLRRLLTNVHRTLKLRAEVHSLRDELKRLGRFGKIYGSSEAMQRVYTLIERVAPTGTTILIVGETGTGKELVAETIHERSARAERPFVAVNCGAVSPSLIETELFGHERGSFTGAQRRHRGIFEQADGGTLLLDEITEMPVELQVKLLRVLETGKIRPVGSTGAKEVDVRVIAASNRPLDRAVEDGALRQDLLYRLSVFPIELPPLRTRGADIVLLAQTFLNALNEDAGTEKTFSEDALAVLRLHDWPGNVRELQNAVERAYIIATSEIGADCLPIHASEAPGTGRGERGVSVPVGTSIADAERRLIFATLDALDGNKRQAAKALGISLKTLYNRLNRYADENRVPPEYDLRRKRG